MNEFFQREIEGHRIMRSNMDTPRGRQIRREILLSESNPGTPRAGARQESLRPQRPEDRPQAEHTECIAHIAMRSDLRMEKQVPSRDSRQALLPLLRMWRLLVIREPPSDSDGERPRLINGEDVSPQHLWDVGRRIYLTILPKVFGA